MKTIDNIRNVVVLDFRTLVIERESISLHVVEPHLISTTCVGLCEHEDGSTYTCVWLEHTAGHRDNGTQLLVIDNLLADGNMGF